MTYTPEQHAEAVEWVKDQITWRVKVGCRSGDPHLILRRYLLGRLEAHAPVGPQCYECWDADEVLTPIPAAWPCKDATAALDAVAEMRQA